MVYQTTDVALRICSLCNHMLLMTASLVYCWSNSQLSFYLDCGFFFLSLRLLNGKRSFLGCKHTLGAFTVFQTRVRSHTP